MTLPKVYMNVVRDLTGYWGTYPPSTRLVPGMVGRVEDGLFAKENTLASYPGFNPAVHGADKPAPNREPVSVWQSKDVVVTSVQADANLPAANASGMIRLGFSKAKDAVLICKGVRSQGLVNLASVKALLHQLLNAKKWNAELCLVTEVRLVKAAWICFATRGDQEAEIKGSGSVGLSAEPLAALTGMAAKGNLSISWSKKKSAGWYTEVIDGGTPLFLAIRFKRGILGLGPLELQSLRGEAKDFEEPGFGESTEKAQNA